MDDTLLGSNHMNLLKETKKFFPRDLKLGEASFIIDIQILQDRSKLLLGLMLILRKFGKDLIYVMANIVSFLFWE